jgi:glycosyltransferase involved in cell wall biosynthesis
MTRPIEALHVFPSFQCGGSQMRFAAIANRLGSRMRHHIAAVDGNYAAAKLFAPGLDYDLLPQPPTKSMLPAVRYYLRLVKQLRPDVVQTYNWGAFEAVIGGWLAGSARVIHTEEGFNRDESSRLKLRRIWLRRLFLNRIYKTVVVSKTLERIALERYRVSPAKLRLIVNGVDSERFLPRRSNELRAQLGISPESFVVGWVGRFSPEKNPHRMVRAFLAAGIENARLVLIGDGTCRPDPAPGVIYTGAVADPAPYYGVFDLFAMSSDTEQMPMSLLEAMAGGLPALCTDVGDSAAMLDAAGPPEIVPRDDEGAYAEALRRLAEDAGARSELGRKNRDLALRRYSLGRMADEYLDLCG